MLVNIHNVHLLVAIIMIHNIWRWLQESFKVQRRKHRLCDLQFTQHNTIEGKLCKSWDEISDLVEPVVSVSIKILCHDVDWEALKFNPSEHNMWGTSFFLFKHFTIIIRQLIWGLWDLPLDGRVGVVEALRHQLKYNISRCCMILSLFPPWHWSRLGMSLDMLLCRSFLQLPQLFISCFDRISSTNLAGKRAQMSFYATLSQKSILVTKSMSLESWRSERGVLSLSMWWVTFFTTFKVRG